MNPVEQKPKPSPRFRCDYAITTKVTKAGPGHAAGSRVRPTGGGRLYASPLLLGRFLPGLKERLPSQAAGDLCC